MTTAAPQRPAYEPEVRDAARRARQIRGRGFGAGPKQHQHVREVVTERLGGAPTRSGVVAQSGFDSQRELRDAASGGLPRERLAQLRPLADAMGDDPWCKGRHLAAALAVWLDELKP